MEDVKEVKTEEPVDDAVVVHDDLRTEDEKINDELVSNVTKMLDPDHQESDDVPAEIEDKEETPSEPEEVQDETPALSDELKARAEGAGISEELAQRLHESGQLEETLAAVDRALIERFQSKETEEKPAKREKKEPPKQEVTEDELPELDPDEYDEALVKRDSYHKQRIDALEAQVAQLLDQQQSVFDRQFDSMVDSLGHDDLFGKGDTVPKDKQENRDKLFKAYQAVCQAFGEDPNTCDVQFGKRALAAMFPEEIFKQNQRKTVQRLRDAEGKFLSKSQTRGAPPPKDASPEEVHEGLVSDVTAYLKKQGVQMSGV